MARLGRKYHISHLRSDALDVLDKTFPLTLDAYTGDREPMKTWRPLGIIDGRSPGQVLVHVLDFVIREDIPHLLPVLHMLVSTCKPSSLLRYYSEALQSGKIELDVEVLVNISAGKERLHAH